MLTRDPPPARRTTRSRGTGGDGKITRDLVLAAALEITGRDGAGQLILEAAEQRGRHHNHSAPHHRADQPAARR